MPEHTSPIKQEQIHVVTRQMLINLQPTRVVLKWELLNPASCEHELTLSFPLWAKL